MPDVAPQVSPALKTLAANLRLLRSKNNWSTRGLAEHARVARATLQRIEGLEFDTLTVGTVDKIARGLGVRTGSMFGRRPLTRRDGEGLIEDVVAENLVRLRALRGLTQDVLGQRSGVSMYVIAHIERRARSADLRTVESLARALRVSVQALLSESSTAGLAD